MAFSTLVLKVLSVTLLLAGCATNPDKIDPIHVSEFKYKDYTCEQMADELAAIEANTINLYLKQKAKHGGDRWRAAVATVFYPSLLFLRFGDEQAAYEYARLQGEFNALTKHIRTRECDIGVRSLEELLGEADADESDAGA